MIAVINQRSRSLFAYALSAVWFLAGHLATAETIGAGLIVEEVKPNFAGNRAGIQPGDILTGWSSSGDAGGNDTEVLSTPFDLAELEYERHPQDPVMLHGLRGDKTVTLTLGPGKWQVQARPQWDEATEARYVEVLEQLQAGDGQSAIDEAIGFAEEIRQRDSALYAAWFLSKAAQTASESGHLPQASQLYELAIEALDVSVSPNAVAFLQHSLGAVLKRQSRFDEAHSAYTTALEIEKAISPQRLGVAANLAKQGSVAIARGKLDSAMRYLQDGLRRQQQLAPDSLLVADTLGEIAWAATTKGDLAQGEQFFRRALKIARALVPDGIEVAKYLNGLGIAMSRQGDEAGAEALYERALAIVAVLEPDSRKVAAFLNNIGTIKENRGDFRAAEDYFRQALAIQQRLAPDSAEVTLFLNNLGVASMLRGDLGSAQAYHQRAYELRKARAPGSMELAISLSNLGKVARYRQDYDAAESYFRDAMETSQRLAPTSIEHARILLNLGLVEQSRGNMARAAKYFENSLSISKSIAPQGRGVAEALTELGDIALARNGLEDAEKQYRQALSIFEAVAPDTYHEAEVLYGLARVHRSRTETELARSFFERAIHALEAQHTRLGGSDESKAHSRAQYLDIYKDYIEFLLQMGEKVSAFNVLERSRSKVLSDLLAERDLVFDIDLPAELERDRRMQARAYEKLQAQLLDTQDPDRVEALQESLGEVRRRQEQIQQQIRKRSPRLADLQYAEPITLDDVRSILKPGTAVLSYAVGESETRLFALTPKGDLEVQTLPLGRAELDSLVTQFRHLIDAGRWDETADTPLVELATTLYRQLLLPVETQINAADRLLIVQDGPLNLLPFAALMRSTSEATDVYLAQWKPSYTVNSLTVYAQLQAQRSRVKPGRLVAFGDPDYSYAAAADRDVDLANNNVTRGLHLTELPWSREEVEDIGEIYRTAATIYTGAEATEQRAKGIPSNVRYIHFAAHAVLNERRPMDTSIVLSAPKSASRDEENGFLQAWEVYESLRLDADLVTLSACETALGTDYPGEGLIGLTRAFQYAGASSVLASLWRVNDRSTSRLMTRFYTHLKAGMPLAEALQQAQIAMIGSAARSDEETRSWLQLIRSWFSGEESQRNHAHPYHWAGFVLSGISAY